MDGIGEALSLFGADGGGFTLGTSGVDFSLPDVSASLPTPATVPASLQLPDISGALAVESAGPSVLDQLSGFAEKLSPFIKAGAGGASTVAAIQAMRQAGQQTDVLRQAEKRASHAAAPAAAAASALTPAGTQAVLGGPLPPELEAEVTNWINQARTRARQAFAHMGITDSTMMEQMDGWIGLQADELRATLAGGLLQAGATQTGVAVQGAQTAGNLAAGQTTQIATAVQQANQALNQLLGATA